MADFLSTLPARFRTIRYDGSRTPDGLHDLASGANCQSYAYAVLDHFGIALPPWRSSELWADQQRTHAVTTFEPLDLLLFSRTGEAFAAHVAVYVGANQALHLCRSVGLPALWSIGEFTGRPEYRVLIGGKRASR